MGASNARKLARKQRFGSLRSEGVEKESSAASDVDLQLMNSEREFDREPKNSRFIVFIGNLPYTATDATIQEHFDKIHPSSIRHRVDKVTGQSKGFAFLEFENYDRMKTCLKLYHHVSFDDTKSPPRKLNVELTVGGGGSKSKFRKSKLASKNSRLVEQRRRRGVTDRKGRPAQSSMEVKGERIESIQEDSIHPSRRSRIPTA